MEYTIREIPLANTLKEEDASSIRRLAHNPDAISI